MVQVNPSGRIVVLGAGPTGLGAAHRLAELGHADFDLYEASGGVGGLARSHIDEAGFLWDMGGHVQFSHYRYFDRLMDELLAGDWIEHERAASVWVAGRFVPYPFQHNLDSLPAPLAARCSESLGQAQARRAGKAPDSFHAWIVAEFGQAIADVFMLPYNRKVWAHDPAELSYQWIGERVAKAADTAASTPKGWGPNRTFRFPRRGGTGEIWNRLASRLPSGRLHLHKKATEVDAHQRVVRFSDGTASHYDALISTMPLDTLARLVGDASLEKSASRLVYSSVHVVGVGLEGQVPDHLAGRSWIYFPESDCPFYRATVFSTYAPGNVPDPARHWSLMLEVSESPAKPVDATRIVADVVEGLRATGLVTTDDAIASTWHTRLEHGYPTPSLGRDAVLGAVLPALERRGILSRGRFGAWKYEVSNQDHSLMQGVEAVDRLLYGRGEPTLGDPVAVNAPGKRFHPADHAESPVR